jgi:hypothetical protein
MLPWQQLVWSRRCRFVILRRKWFRRLRFSRLSKSNLL